MQTAFRIMNQVRISLEDKKTGKIDSQQIITNTPCRGGLNAFANRMMDYDDTAQLGLAKHIEIGTGITAENVEQTSLATPYKRSAIIQADSVINETTSVIKVYARFDDDSVVTITEVALFGNAESIATLGSGAMYARALLDASISKTATKAVTIEWTISLVVGV